ncbi:hypothetical protein [Nitrospira moscoviensis]|uniref:3-keto-disaccharide hydrolase domain-containing protein n=1 Tax=Nitrospira moscoviensis TaxID=42253 RepID=A0A0K2GFE0_NITMO|nr:hypothetical protein [Nitrospira moscoviensis]ALA59673.1 exported protein of unknown function [Nitrospira moscoviensis]
MRRQQTIAAAMLMAAALSSSPAEARGPRANQNGDAGHFALNYAEALAHARIEAWAAADLSCLTRLKTAGKRQGPEWARDCWDATLNAHTAMVAQDVETGVFDAVGRGAGFGLLHDRHRATENWKEYPPAVFLSPPIVRRDNGPAPEVRLVRVHPAQPTALLNVKGSDPVTVQGHAVDVTIVYPDPITAPLALRPEEIWWVSGAQRRFGPVREVQVRFIVVSGLKKFGYAEDRAVMNEILPGAPLIPTTQYGLRPEAGRRFDPASINAPNRLLKGELLPGTARWWERSEAELLFRQAVGRAAHLPAGERAALLTRLLLLDPTDAETHRMRGEDAYLAFLRQGVTKGGLAARDEPALWRAAELYWTLQAQTWRQELTAVAEGYEPAADTLYRAIASYDQLAQTQQATPEERRRLGALNRWNNDPGAALAIHEPLLAESSPDTPFYGLVLADIAWDRIQWVSWERRYDHPWLEQAVGEAQKAAALLSRPEEKVIADYVLVAAESLRVPRDAEAFTRQLALVKQDVDRIPGTKGLLGHLVANDLVKALTPEARTVVLPSPPRSMEVLDVAVHANPPKQDIVWQWNFDQDVPGAVPTGFLALRSGGSEAADWQVAADRDGGGQNQLLTQANRCATPGCVRLLVAERARATYPDLTVQIRAVETSGEGEAGLALAVRDDRNYYAVTLQPSTGLVTTRRVSDGTATILGQVAVKLAARPWHTLRVQRINFLHLDKGRLGVYVDGAQVAAVDDAVLPAEGRVGVITLGPAAAQFDSLHLLDLVSNRPLSKPAAY